MSQRLRTVKTLVCLAVAMTATASLLGWMDPAQFADTGRLSRDEIVLLARCVVHDGVELRARSWREIDVTMEFDPASSGTMLAGMADTSAWHFRIAADGRIQRSDRWRRQQAAPGSPSAIIVVVEADAPETTPPNQSIGLTALLDVINESVAPYGVTLPIVRRPA